MFLEKYMVLYNHLTHKFYQGSTNRLVQVLTGHGAWISEPYFMMIQSKKVAEKYRKQPMELKVADDNPELTRIDPKVADD